MFYDIKGKSISVTGCGGPCCETIRLPHFLDNWLTDGHPLSPGKFLVVISVTG
jgi:hypothetical protein